MEKLIFSEMIKKLVLSAGRAYLNSEYSNSKFSNDR